MDVWAELVGVWSDCVGWWVGVVSWWVCGVIVFGGVCVW